MRRLLRNREAAWPLAGDTWVLTPRWISFADTVPHPLGHLSASSSTQSIQDVVRQVQVQLAFPSAAALLRHLDVTIAGRDVPAFVNRGKSLRNGKEKPFTTAFTSYLRTHLALDLSHPKVHISRITCGSFVYVVHPRRRIP